MRELRERAGCGACGARRGFTLLELSLATFIGAVVVITGVAVINSMFTTDQTMDRRFSEVNDIERTRRIVQRSLTMLVMSDVQLPNDAAQLASGSGSRSSTSRGTSGSGSSGGNTSTGTSGEGSETSTRKLPPPRFVLGVSDDPAMASVIAALRNQGSNQAAVQTLEVVCSRPPVPSGTPRTVLDQVALETTSSDTTTASENDTKSLPKAARGRFEFLPASDRLGNYWEMWWRPLPPLDNDGNTLTEFLDPAVAEAKLGTPMRLCSRITEFKWTAFNDGENQTALSAIVARDLPAYMRLEMKTRAGISVDWLFEIDYSSGAETGSTVSQADTGPAEGGGGGGGGGGGPRGGGPRGGGGGGGNGNAGNGPPTKDHSGGPTIRTVPRPRRGGGGGGGGGN